MGNSVQKLDMALLLSYYDWLIVVGKSKATARAYFLEVSRCVNSASSTCKDSLSLSGDVFDKFADRYINDDSLSLSTRRRRFHAIALFSKFSGVILTVKRPKAPMLSESQHSFVEKVHLKNGAIINESSLPLSLTLINKEKRRWKITGLRDRAMTLLAIVCRLKTSKLVDLRIDSIAIDGNKAVLSTGLSSFIIPELIRATVLEYLVARHERHFESEFLFINSRGGPLSIRTVQSGIKRYLKDCGNSDSSSSCKVRKKFDEIVGGKLTKGFLRKLAANR